MKRRFPGGKENDCRAFPEPIGRNGRKLQFSKKRVWPREVPSVTAWLVQGRPRQETAPDFESLRKKNRPLLFEISEKLLIMRRVPQGPDPSEEEARQWLISWERYKQWKL
jgi:hypothetical protein